MDRDDEAAGKPIVPVLWPREEDYPRFVAVCTDRPPATYADFIAKAQPYVDALRHQGVEFRLVEPDPDQMAAWCRANYGHVNTNARAMYAAVVDLGVPTDKDSIN